MKRFFILLAILFCGTAYAQTETLNWYMDGNTYATTTCESGNDILLPTTPTKRGYTFKGWAGYIPIEYLESTGTQYIDTGLIFNTPSTRLDYSLKVSVLGREQKKGTFVSNETSTNEGFNIEMEYGNIIFYSAPYVEGCPGTTCSYITNIDYDKNFVEYTGYFSSNGFQSNLMNIPFSYNTPYLPQSPKSITLYKNAFTSTKPYIGKIYYVRFMIDNILVRDFIPVLDSNNVPCMYDKVERKFYYNQGTGQFIAGPVLTE